LLSVGSDKQAELIGFDVQLQQESYDWRLMEADNIS